MFTNESQDVTAMGFTMAELVRLRRLCGRSGGIDELERLVSAAEAAQERDRALQRIRTPENLTPYSAASTARASDLPRRFICGFVFLALFAYALPDLRAWWNGEPPVMIGGQP